MLKIWYNKYVRNSCIFLVNYLCIGGYTMKKIQQTENTVGTTDSLSFEMELNNFIEKAIKEGYSTRQATEYAKKFIRENWYNHVNLPEENAAEKTFRAKAQAFFEVNYENFDDYCKGKVFAHWSWPKLENDLGTELKKRLIYEMAGGMYKGFEMETLDKSELRRDFIERVKKLIPEVKKYHAIYFDIMLDALLEYAKQYECPKECDEFLDQFELQNYYDFYLCKFIWIIENV